MKRQFPYAVLASGGTPQPVFGTTLTAAVGPKGTDGNSLQSIAVASSAWFSQGDWFVLDPLNSTAAKRERLRVESIPDSTHIKVSGIQYTHVNSTFVQLAEEVNTIYIQCKPGNSGIIYVGGQGMVASTGPFYALLINTASGIQPIDFTDSIGSGQNVMSTADYWFDGTTSDSILPSVTVL